MSEIIFLTQEERDKFAAWLEQDAASTEDVVAKMRAEIEVTEKMIKFKRAEFLAQRIVARMLRNIVGVLIEGDPKA